MVALVGAMFVAIGSVSAVSLNDCSPTAPTTMGIGDTCLVEVGSLSAPDDVNSGATAPSKQDYVTSSNDEIANVDANGQVTAGGMYGTATITVVDYTAANANATPPVAESTKTTTYRVTTAKIAVTKIEFGAGEGEDFIADTDNVFKAGTDVVLRLTVSHADSGSGDITTVVSVPTTGLSLKAADGTTQRKSDIDTGVSVTAGQGSVTTTDFVLITDGAPDGEYEVTATASQGADAAMVTSAKFPAKLTIGDAGDVVADATLELGLMEGPSDGDATNDESETGSVGRTGNINLVLSVTNGIDNPARAADVDEIRVVAPFGDVKYYDGSGPEPVAADPKAMASKLMKGSLVINIASSGGKARTIDAYAIVLGKVGVATTGTVSLNFTGDAASVDLADATENLRSINLEDEMDSIKLMVTAADSSGNTAAVPDPLTITVHDPDGKQLATSGDSRKIDAERMTESGKTVIKVTNRSGNDADTALKVGEYTVKVTSGSINDSAMFMVVGGADELSIEADNMAPSEIAERVVVKATVRSGDQPVADGTVVTFMSRDTTGDSDSVLVPTMSETPGTKDGVATATYVVIGAGSAVVTATADGQVGVVVVESTAGMVEPEAMPEEEVSVGCLSNLSGFSTWSCGVESSASEIFGLVSARGVTAIHLHNGTAWVRYSVVDGAMVPGSSDFMVTENDILYISN